MTAEQIRADAIRAVAEDQHNYCQHTPDVDGPWDEEADACPGCLIIATHAVDALSAAGLLVTVMEEWPEQDGWILSSGGGMDPINPRRYRRYLTDKTEIPND